MTVDPRDTPSSRFGGNVLGIAVLAVTFFVSLGIAVHNTLTIDAPDKTVVRIAHWQLEHGYRDALQTIIDDYEKLHPGVRIEQIPVPEITYGQAINTQLIGNTAPDICEMGKSDLLTQDDSTIRYFVPLSSEIVKPNPYNKGTDLEKVQWKETLLDGMLGGFRPGLAEYYSVPTTLTSMRIFYNKQLLKTIVGSDAPPKTFGEWMAMCRQIRAYAAKQNNGLLPLISGYDINAIQQQYEPPFTASFAPDVDLDMDGIMSPLETYIAYCQNKVNLQTPAVKALYETIRTIGDQMQQGFSAVDRQQAQFRFVNGLVVFLWTGSWDASGTVSQATEKGFETGIFKIPLPAPNEPNGQYIIGPASESISGAGCYGISKGSTHQEIALDFLRYFTSQAVNEKFNQLAEWPPITIGAKPSQLMEPFTADRRGYSAKLQFEYGTRVAQAVDSQIINYYQGDSTYEQFVNTYDTVIRDPYRGGDWAWWYEFDQSESDVRSKERVLAQQQTLDLLDHKESDPDRYRRSLLQEVIRNDALDYPYLFQKYRGMPMPRF